MKLKDMEELKEEFVFTTNINEALWILEDGSMLDGEYDMGMRGLDHRMIEGAFDGDKDRYDDDFWDIVHSFNMIRLVPETGFALIGKNQQLNDIQKSLLASTSFEIEKY